MRKRPGGGGRPAGAALFRLTMWFYPRRQREEWGAEMQETLQRRAAELTEASRLRRVMFWMREYRSLAAAGVWERMTTRRGSSAAVGEGSRRGVAALLVEGALELRHAWRRLGRSRGFTVASILTLGLAMGAATSVFTLVQRVLLNPLPYPESERLVDIDHGAAGLDMTAGMGTTDGLHRLYASRATSFAGVALYWTVDLTLSGGGDPERVQMAHATAPLVSVMGVPPAIGRWFTENESLPGGPPLVVISHGLWSRWFGADPGIVGRVATIEGVDVEVIGVMPAGFAFPTPGVEAWLPARFDPAHVRVHGFRYRSVARLKPGVEVGDATAELDGLIAQLEEIYPGDPGARSLVHRERLLAFVQPLRSAVVGGVARTLWVLLGAVAVVLAVACANVANLFLVRAEARLREVAVRRALGSGRGDLAKIFLTESVLISIAGGLIGLLMAYAGVRLLASFGPQDLPRLHEVHLDGAVYLFAVMMAAATTLVFGLVPLSQGDARASALLAQGGRTGTASRSRVRVRHLLMGGQVALALVLLADSGLLIRSFRNLTSIDAGFEPGPALTFAVGLPQTRYAERQAVVEAHRELLDGLRALPGAEAASAISCLPLSGMGYCHGSTIDVEGRPTPEGTIPRVVAYRVVASNYFESLRSRLTRGRTLAPADFDSPSDVVVINEALAAAYFPGENPIGRRVAASGSARWLTVVGVVANTPTNALDESAAPKLYLPMRADLALGPSIARMSFVIRTTGPPLALLADVRRVVSGIDPGLAVSDVATLSGTLQAASAGMAFAMVLLTLAAAVALVLGLVGIYGVISYVVSRRTTEIGVRLALGAGPSDIRRMVLRQGGIVTVAGLGLGLLAALGTASLVQALLYGVSPWDLRTYVTAALFLVGNALLACWLPARHAARLPPNRALQTG